ncbi:YbgF trimerization domain-containing protein [Cellvibrio sp. ARAG 10.3]
MAQPIESVNAQTNAYFELQSLKEEVSLLRGLVEEQAHEISRLKQQQMDNYMDLDKRLTALSGRSGNPASVDAPLLPPSPVENAGGGVSPPNSNSALGEAEVYAAAYNLLKQRQIDAAIAAFKDHLTRFPNGAYAGNSYYWLGEIYLLKNELPDSRDWFSQLLEKFPNDRKVPDAKFKLGKVYHLLGENDRARKLLEDVAAGSGDSARLARQYMQENF